MLSMAENQLAHILALIGALLHNVAVVLEQVIDKKLVEVAVRAVGILINLSGKCLAEDEGVHEAARDWLQLSEQHQQVSIEDGQFVGALVKGLNDHINIFLELFNEGECEVVGELSHIVEECCHHIVLNAELRHLVVRVLATSVSNHFLKNVRDGLFLLFVSNSLGRQDS